MRRRRFIASIPDGEIKENGSAPPRITRNVMRELTLQNLTRVRQLGIEKKWFWLWLHKLVKYVILNDSFIPGVLEAVNFLKNNRIYVYKISQLFKK